jgi:membrane-associated phospholipid phosphatase
MIRIARVQGSMYVRPVPARILCAYLALTTPLAAAAAWRSQGALGGMLLLAHVTGVLVTGMAARRVRQSVGGDTSLRNPWILLPLVAFPLLYSEIPFLLRGIGGGYHDAIVQEWELAVFGGVSPVRSFPATLAARLAPPVHAAASTVLHLGYLSFYLIIYVPLLTLFLRGDGAAFLRTLTGVTTIFIVGFLAFLLFPVQGPRYLWSPSTEIPQGAVRALAGALLETGSSRGTAFPSSHVAIAVAQTLFATRWQPRLAWALALATVLLALGAVYGGYHYAADVLAGLLTGGATGAAFLLRWRGVQRHAHA